MTPTAKHPEFIQCKQPTLTVPKKGDSCEVTFPVSYRYNGGTVVDDKWYQGYYVPAPKVPNGWELVSIGVGLQLNAHPPYATMVMRKIQLRSHTRYNGEDGKAYWNLTEGKKLFTLVTKGKFALELREGHYEDGAVITNPRLMAQCLKAIQMWYGKAEGTFTLK